MLAITSKYVVEETRRDVLHSEFVNLLRFKAFGRMKQNAWSFLGEFLQVQII